MNYLKNLTTNQKINISPEPGAVSIDGSMSLGEWLNDVDRLVGVAHFSYQVSTLQVKMTFDYESHADDISVIMTFFNELKIVNSKLGSVPKCEISLEDRKIEIFVKSIELKLMSFTNTGAPRTFVVELDSVIVPDQLNEVDTEVLARSTAGSGLLDADRLKVKIVDEDNEPLGGVRCEIEFKDGSIKTGRSTDDGFLDIPDIKKGAYKLRLLDLDESCVDGNSGTIGPEGDEKIEHIVSQGESLSTIGRLYGVSWKLLWDDKANKEIKKKRKNPDIIYPGDIVYIPPAKVPEFNFSTGRDEKILVKSTKVEMSFTLTGGDGPIKNQNCEFEYERGKIIKGKSDGAGKVKMKVPSHYKKGILKFLHNKIQFSYEIHLNTLDPVEEETGVIQRLHNLGFMEGMDLEISTGEAAMAYLDGVGYETSDKFDQDTIDAIKKDYGV